MNSKERKSAGRWSRRRFAKASLVALGLPMFQGCRSSGTTTARSRAASTTAPSGHINVAQIGCGRIARSMDIPGILKHSDQARIVAVCDMDEVRLAHGRELVEQRYSAIPGPGQAVKVNAYKNYREMLQDRSIDAVVISTPDHWHALPAIEAALAGKDVFLQKPASLTISEGRQMADVIARTGRIFQMGSQQRSEAHFRKACELVRNGYIGNLQRIKIGLPGDPSGGSTVEMPVPSNLDYGMWLGSTPEVYYTQDRVHPQSADASRRYDRPGWLRCEQFGAGMITGWGTHHIDIAHWAMGMEHSGPVWVEAQAEFPTKGLWDVHGKFRAEAKYANGVLLEASDQNPVGLRFEGDEGWIWVTRKGGAVTSSDPTTTNPSARWLDASNPKLLEIGLKDSDVHLHQSYGDHHADWLHSINIRKPAVAPAEDGHRSCSACLLIHASMKLGRKLNWDPASERFVNDDQASKLLRRPQREPYGTEAVLKKQGIPIRV